MGSKCFIDAPKRGSSCYAGRGFGREAIEIPNFFEFLQKHKAGLMTVTECCSALGISRSTWYKRMQMEGAF